MKWSNIVAIEPHGMHPMEQPLPPAEAQAGRLVRESVDIAIIAEFE